LTHSQEVEKKVEKTEKEAGSVSKVNVNVFKK